MIKEIRLRANGKLLISGEYLVLAGAKAVAFPLRFGQSIHVNQSENRILSWISVDTEGTWFRCDIDPVTLNSMKTTDARVSSHLVMLLKAARKLNPSFLQDFPGLDITVKANYPLKWGLGSSSTLIALIAGWAETDKFGLFRLISIGSGFDVACTDRNSIFLYQLKNGEPSMEDIIPGKAILDHTCFGYLGNKQDSPAEVAAFLTDKKFTPDDVTRISSLSMEISMADEPSAFISLIEEHEEIMSRILRKNRIAKQFPGFPGTVKSLGAWGGDFAMFASTMKNHQIKAWLKQSGFHDIFTFEQLKVPR